MDKAVSATQAAISPQATLPLESANITRTSANLTFYHFQLPTLKHIVRLPLRIAVHLDRVLFRALPMSIFRASGIASLSQVASSNADGLANGAGQIGAEAVAGGAAIGEFTQQTTMAGIKSTVGEAFQLSNIRSYWGMLNYITSRWAFTCFSMVSFACHAWNESRADEHQALILNRVNVYGSSRQRILLKWDKRLALRIIPILLFVSQIRRLLEALRCQSSPDFPLLRYGTPDKYNPLDWHADGSLLHWFTSKLLYSATDAQSCAAIGMSRPSLDVRPPYGSFSLLWPTFLRLCLSHFVETLSCALQQQPLMTEVGMSIFEHSLAFAEAETMISHVLGIGLFGSSKSKDSALPQNMTTIAASAVAMVVNDATTSLTGPHLLDKLNVPVEVLLISLLSCCNALTANIIAVFNKQRQLRLLNTAFWGVCFMSAFVWGFFNTSPLVRRNGKEDIDDVRFVSGLLHFPTVCIIGFVPHMMVLFGVVVCTGIYSLALILTAISLSTNSHIRRPSTFRTRFRIAHENLQAAIQVRGINIKWHEDFYTSLLRLGFVVLTAASEAVFLNEGRSVEVREFTWLEEDSLDEIESSRASGLPRVNGSQFQIAERYGLPNSMTSYENGATEWQSGYAKERKLDKDQDHDADGETSIVYPNPRPGGVGALQRTTRFYLLFVFLRGIYCLIVGWMCYWTGRFLDRVGVTSRPRWLRRVVGKSLKRAAREKEHERRLGASKNRLDTLDFWLLNEQGDLITPGTDDLDIEPEMRRRLMLEHSAGEVDQVLDTKLYGWWKIGGWWGTRDESGDYRPVEEGSEDTTSVFSMSTTASTTDEGDDREWGSDSDGRRTPTQHSPFPSRETTPAPFSDTPLDSATLARLLNPRDRTSREEATILASHLASAESESSNRIMTRSRFRYQQEIERARVLLSRRGLSRPTASSPEAKQATAIGVKPLAGAEEAETLESLILSRRQARAQARAPSADDQTSFSASGPQCVVCQSAPRTIIAWPCRCLCACEDCRVSLALNNFGNCVTCRRSVTGFVRLWVP